MSSLVWDLNTLKTIKKLDYMWEVIKKVENDKQAKVHFGCTKDCKKHAPHYLIKCADGTETPYRGNNHKVYEEKDSFKDKNLSLTGFTVAQLKEVFDHQSKSDVAAIALMDEYWKANKHNFSPNLEAKKYRTMIIALSARGTPIARAFDLAINTQE
ncbi:hypothetical protein [Shewanella sp. 0m-4]